MADNNYENPQVGAKQFAPEPRRLGTPDPPKPAFKPHPRRSQDMQTRDYYEDYGKGLHDYLEQVMTESRPGAGLPGDQFQGPGGACISASTTATIFIFLSASAVPGSSSPITGIRFSPSWTQLQKLKAERQGQP